MGDAAAPPDLDDSGRRCYRSSCIRVHEGVHPLKARVMPQFRSRPISLPRSQPENQSITMTISDDQHNVIGDLFPVLLGLDRLGQHQADAAAGDRADDRGRAGVGFQEIEDLASRTGITCGITPKR